jgi:hypothetical protein
LVSELLDCTDISTGTVIGRSDVVSWAKEEDGGKRISKEEKYATDVKNGKSY